MGRRLKLTTPIPNQRVDIDRLHPGLDGMVAIIAAPPGGITEIGPVRRPVAATTVASAIDKRLHQHGRLAVDTGPVVRESCQHRGEHMGGQPRDSELASDQETRVAHNALEVLATARIIPADPGVAGVQPPCRRREGERGHIAEMLAAHPISQAPPNQRSGTEKMLRVEQRLPAFTRPVAVDRLAAQFAQIAEPMHLNRGIPVCTRPIIQCRQTDCRRIHERTVPAHDGVVQPTCVSGSDLNLLRFDLPQIRTFHFTWLAFHLCFFGWFGVAPLMAVIRDNLALTKWEVGMASTASVAATIIMRLILGPLCDKVGPRKTYGWLLMLGSIPVMAIGLATSFESFLFARLCIGAIGASFVITQYHTSVMFAPNS